MEKIKKIRYYLLALVFPLILCLIFLNTKKIFSNIEYFFVTDLKMQHFSFLNYMKNVLLGNASIYYSFSAGMGSTMIATMIFYAISPINLLLVLVKDVQYAILYVYICKLCLASLSMFILLKSKTQKESLTTIIFSTCYAICAFSINYFFCIFWLDSLYLAPLVMYGIDKIVKEEKISLVYILSLALTIICNIQMGFGLCIYSVIYFAYAFMMKYNIKENFKKLRQIGILFAISSLCAGAISSGALLGFTAEYNKITAARDILSLQLNTTNIGLTLKNLFTVGNLTKEYFNDFEPFIYSGLIVSFFAMLYLFGSHEKDKKRYPARIVVLIFLLSFFTKGINLFWHISNPVLLNFRYSIYLTGFLCMIAYECYCEKNKLTSKDIKILVTFVLIGLFMIVAYSGEVFAGYTSAFLLVISIGIYLTKNKSKKFEIPLYLLVALEIILNAHISLYGPYQLKYDRYTSYKKLKNLIEKNNLDDNYRVMYNYSYLENTNETLLYNRNSSLRYFSSVIDGNLISFFNNNMSKVGNNNYQVSAYDSPLLLSLLGNKYFYMNNEYNNSIYKKIDTFKITDYDYILGKTEEKEIYLYENPYALSLGYIINNDVNNSGYEDGVDYQNDIIKSFTGIDDEIIKRLDFSVGNNTDYCNESYGEECQSFNIINNTNNKLVYIYGPWNVYNTKDGTNVYYDTNNPLVLSSLNRNVEIGLYFNNIKNENFVITTYDEEKLINALTQLQQNMLKNIKVNKNVMTGNIDAKKSGILFLSIPYEKKFTVYVDGKKTKYFPVVDKTFMGLNIKEGNHKIKIKYVDNDLTKYIASSILSLIITIVIWYIINKKIEKKKQLEKQKELEKIKEKNKKLELKKQNELKNKNKANTKKKSYKKKTTK